MPAESRGPICYFSGSKVLMKYIITQPSLHNLLEESSWMNPCPETQQPWVAATRPWLFYHQLPSTKSSTVFDVVAHSVSHVWLCDPMDCSTPGFPVLQYLPESVETRIHWVGDAIQLPNHLILCHPFLLLSLIFPSIRVFSNESILCIWWPKYWSFSFSISSSNEYSGLISFRIDFFDLFVVQGILKSLLQHSLKAPILPGSAFFMVQFSHLYMTTGKTSFDCLDLCWQNDASAF